MTVAVPLASRARRALDRLAADLRKIFGDRFVSLVAYGRGHSVAFATTLDVADLDACGALIETWHRDGLESPLILTPDEFRRSLDTFPIEYQAIMDAHVVIDGRPPFVDLRVDLTDLRRACEIQARGFLIHLRQGWMNAAGHADRRRACLVASAAPLHALLSSVARLDGRHAAVDLPAFAYEKIGMPAGLVRDIIALKDAPDDAASLVPRTGEYLAACERLWDAVDTWKS